MADILIGLAMLCVLAFAMTVFLHLVILRVPYVPTPRVVVRAMLRLAHLRKGEVVYDLGAGDGRILIAAKRRTPSIRATGFEVVPLVWLLGKLCIWFSRLPIAFRMRDALSQDLRDADVIFLYLTPSLLSRLAKKFDRELRHGTRVVSHDFAFEGRRPVTELTLPWGRRRKCVRLYQW